MKTRLLILASAIVFVGCSQPEPIGSNGPNRAETQAESSNAGQEPPPEKVEAAELVIPKTAFEIELESAINSLAIREGEKPVDALKHEQLFPDDCTMRPEGLKILIAHFFDPRQMVGRIQVDPTDEERMGLAIPTHSIGLYLESLVGWDVKETSMRGVGRNLEYMRSADALTEFIKECDYDMTKMRARYKVDMAKFK